MLNGTGPDTPIGLAQTTDATPGFIATVPQGGQFFFANGIVAVEFTVMGRKSDGSLASFWKCILYLRVDGSFSRTQVGSLAILQKIQDAGASGWGDPSITMSGGNALLYVTGVAATTIDWIYFGPHIWAYAP